LSFTKHVDDLSEKAANHKNILLTNTNGPIMPKRRVLAGALQSALTSKMHQRAIAWRCYCDYSTVSADAAALVAGMVPIDLLILERKRVRDRMKPRSQFESCKRGGKVYNYEVVAEPVGSKLGQHCGVDSSAHKGCSKVNKPKPWRCGLPPLPGPDWTWLLSKLPSQNNKGQHA